MIIADFLIILAYCVLIGLAYNGLVESKREAQHRVNKATVNHDCKEYLMTIKGSADTGPYGYLIGFINSFICYVLLKLTKSYSNISNEMIYLAVLLIFIISFGSSYKIINCFIARAICPSDCGLLDGS